MINRLYSLYDRRLREYGAVATAKNDEAVKRGIQDSIRGSGSVVEKHPEDFDVCLVGEFDDTTGEVGRFAVQVIANVGELIAQNKEA